DLLFLVEVDCGMARSGNRHVARELAESLGMSYGFVVSYLALEDDIGENPDGCENELALAGLAVLTRVPLLAVASIDLPELRDKFPSSEKRLGKKRALAARVQVSDGALDLAVVHLDSTASPRQRARQLRSVLEHLPAGRALVGGDLNS